MIFNIIFKNYLYALFIRSIFIIIIFNTFIECSNEGNVSECFPKSTVSVAVNVTLPAYSTLQNIGGWTYLDATLAGTRGLIIVRTGAETFKAYDRNAPHICPSSNSTLIVEKDIAIICPQDNAKWILSTGEPIAVTGITPKTYNTSYNAISQILQIMN